MRVCVTRGIKKPKFDHHGSVFIIKELRMEALCLFQPYRRWKLEKDLKYKNKVVKYIKSKRRMNVYLRL